ncbi:hypothetical protein KIN20_008067 [Parelaphostrongylus tenuis]|uniref:Uncharacterized protein n=1 Tax=Parelaphostrongylus tenuis TaxID=148309 RepID=A0AAD5MWB3_PARTN|nr:hypothetical protein KIN20_008067 [Parelaphostrongylus tenuis]
MADLHDKRKVDEYLIAGVSEQIRDFIALLDRLLPRFYNGALMHFDSLDESLAHLRNTKRKHPPSDHTVSTIRRNEAYQLERESFTSLRRRSSKRFSIVLMGRVCHVM